MAIIRSIDCKCASVKNARKRKSAKGSDTCLCKLTSSEGGEIQVLVLRDVSIREE